MKQRLGICQWFHYQAFDDLERVVAALRNLGVTHLRTGVSWADFHRPEGRAWYDHQMEMLRDFEVLLSVWHTPPSIAEGAKCAGPPLRLEDYGEFLEHITMLYGDRFDTFELWNEPNNRLKWDFENFDPKWEKFSKMIAYAAERVGRCGKRSVLGGMVPVDPEWLRLVRSQGALEHVDAVAIHGFPQMWWPTYPNWDWHAHWRGWNDKVAVAAAEAEGRPIWITETGLATWDLFAKKHHRYQLQADCLREAAAAPSPRVYWYSVMDLDPDRDAIEGFHVDENEYHLGLVDYRGTSKPAFDVFRALLLDEAQDQVREACASAQL